MEVTKFLDAIGLACPMPIVKTKKAIGELERGLVLEVNTTENDLAAWAKSGGHELLKYEEDHGVLKFWNKKG